MKNVPTVNLGGIETIRLSRAGICELMVEDCLAARAVGQRARTVFDLNGHGIALASSDENFRRELLAADLVHADGQAFVIASRLMTKTPVAERSATTDLFHDAADYAIGNLLSFFLLGGTEPINESCADKMQQLHPGLKITGRRNGYFSDAEEQEICDLINASGADILWVGLGKPKEQAFCVRNRHRLRVGWIITCGGCFNYVVGAYGRAPIWVQKVGFEWLYRLLRNPRQFGWRYLTTNPVALYLLLTKTRSGAVDAQ